METISKPHPRMVHLWALKVLAVPLILWLAFGMPIVLFLGGAEQDPVAAWIRGFLLIGAVAVLLLLTGYAWAVLYRRFYRWQLRDEEIRVWRGILFRKRITIPYMRVQNVSVVRGPLLLLFGLSGVEVETAGQKGTYYGGFYPTEGYLPGVVDGDSLADAIIDRVKGAKAREGL